MKKRNKRSHTCGKDARPDHLVHIEKDNSNPSDIIAQGRVVLNGRPSSLLVRRFRAIPPFDASKSQIPIVHDKSISGTNSRRGCETFSCVRIRGSQTGIHSRGLEYARGCSGEGRVRFKEECLIKV